MRKIIKHSIPEYLKTFIDEQMAIEPEPVNLTYRNFPHKSDLRLLLTNEQFGLCGYTGAPVDEHRISTLRSFNEQTTFSNHIEHLKCQQACREELEARGQEYGRALGEDLDYQNLIAALKVSGAETEQFGAAFKGNKRLPILPTHDGCSEHFVFVEGDGSVKGTDSDAKTNISVLDLNHDTLKGWRLAAIETWLDPQLVKSEEDLKDVLRAVTEPRNGELPEYAFVIESITRQYLNEANI